MNRYIAQVINLIPDRSQHFWSGDLAGARRALLAADPKSVLEINGSFALVAQEGERVVLVRSLERPLRYFLAKAADGPVLIVAERIDEIAAELGRRGSVPTPIPSTGASLIHRAARCRPIWI